MAVYDNTTVIITPEVPLKGNIPAGQQVTVTLNRGQSYAVEAASSNPEWHLRGTRITSDKPISVFQLTANYSNEMGGTVLPQMRCSGFNKVVCRRPDIGGGLSLTTKTLFPSTSVICRTRFICWK